MRRSLLLLLSFILLNSCSIQKLAVSATGPIFSNAIEALYAEPDLKVAETAIASNLKLLEGFHRTDPDNKEILLFLTQGFASLSLAFMEETEPDRASRFYLRSRDYGFDLLKKTSAFKDGIPETEEAFKAQLPKIKDDEVGALFWTAFAWSGWINLHRDDAQAVFDLGVVKAMMDRVIEIDESYFFGAAHLFWGSISGSIPRMLGGDPEKAKMHFEKARELSGDKFLITRVYMAQFYAATTLNEELFDELLHGVLEAPEDINPGFELMTSLAKLRAQRLLDRKDDLL